MINIAAGILLGTFLLALIFGGLGLALGAMKSVNGKPVFGLAVTALGLVLSVCVLATAYYGTKPPAAVAAGVAMQCGGEQDEAPPASDARVH